MLKFRWFLMMLVAGSTLGCGVNSYVEQVHKSQKRLKHLESIQKLLEGELDVQKQLGKPAARVTDLYFRPPKGVATAPDENFDVKGALSRYKGDNDKDGVYYLYLGVAVRGEKATILQKGKEVEVTGQRAFEAHVLGALGWKGEKLTYDKYKTKPAPGDPVKEMERISFEKQFEQGRSQFLIYLAEEGRVAIVFEITGNPGATTRARDVSLSTLRINEQASASRSH